MREEVVAKIRCDEAQCMRALRNQTAGSGAGVVAELTDDLLDERTRFFGDIRPIVDNARDRLIGDSCFFGNVNNSDTFASNADLLYRERSRERS